MQNKLHITCIQPDIIWENPQANIQKYTELIQSISQKADLIVLPEMFSTGFSMNPINCAESMNGLSISWMKRMASERQIGIVGSLAIKEGNQYFNRMLFVTPNGELKQYDKRHLFTLAGEDKVYTAGGKKIIIDYLGWKICPLVCYDLRFPAWSRNNENYDVLIYVANWPKPRISAWDTLLKARSIENMCYTIGVNRVGVDANGFQYIGHSQGISPLGGIIANSTNNSECTVSVILDKSELVETRNKFQFLNDKDSFEIL